MPGPATMPIAGSYGAAPGTRLAGLGWVIGIHALLLYLVLSGSLQQTVSKVLKKPLEAVVLQEVTLPPQPPPAPRTPVHEPRSSAAPVLRPPTVAEAPVAAPQAPVATEAPARVERVAEPVAAVPTAPAPLAEPVHKAPSHATAEAEYAARLKVLLNGAKRYPTGRQASQQRPQGTVRVWFTLNRAGSLFDLGLLEAADSNLLNDAALATVRRVIYPPFGAELWPGQEQHRFMVDIDFQPPG